MYLMLANELVHQLLPDAVTIAEDVSGGACAAISAYFSCCLQARKCTWLTLPCPAALCLLRPCRHARAVPPSDRGRRRL